jgi:prepilin-type N-terminal cleavage/methylation domain-containing protein
MPTLENALHRESGVTLVELLVVVTIITIVAALALMQRGSANEQFQRQNVSQQLKVAFERARFDSVKRRAVGGSAPMAEVLVASNSVTLRTYRTDVNGAAVANDQLIQNPNGIIIERLDGTALTNAMTVAFDMRGETSQSPQPRFRVCNGTCDSPSTATSDIVIVTPTGTVNLLPGSGTVPNFNSPAVSNAAPPVVNPDAVLP